MLPSLMAGSNAFNLITIGGIGGFHFATGVVYRVCVYISLMTSGEFVLTKIVRSIKRNLVCCIFWTIFSDKQNCVF